MEKVTFREQRERVPAPPSVSSVAVMSKLNTVIDYQSSRFYAVAKRLIDIMLSLISIIGLLPVFLIIAIFIKLDDGGPVLYRREMVGQRGRPFLMLKFRTMIPNADTYLEEQTELLQEFEKNMKLEHDPRITRVGVFLRKTYFDELPQVFNILVGHMSLVGPRAIHERELELYKEYAKKRHIVKPGLTGLWQISPDRHRSYEERIPLDMQYVDTCSFTVDFLIMVKTLKVLFARTGI